MLIFVETLSGKLITLDVETRDTIGDVKARFHGKEGVSLRALILNGNKLEDGRTLAYYKVQKESTLHCEPEDCCDPAKWSWEKSKDFFQSSGHAADRSYKWPVECSFECESVISVIRIRNTFIEWVALTAGEAQRRPSSSPPTLRRPETHEVSEVSDAATQCRLPGPLVRMLDQAPAPVQAALAEGAVQAASPGIPVQAASPGSPVQSRQPVQAASPGSQSRQSSPVQTLHNSFDDKYGLPPWHPLWIGQAKILIRNIPCRCTAHEIENFITKGGVLSEKWTIVLPGAEYGKRNRGYAFITAADPSTAMELVRLLWQQSIPTRGSGRALKLQPAFEDKKEGQLLLESSAWK